jgi:hypothetical protein
MKAIIIFLGLILTAAPLYAGNGDLIVNGNLGVGTTGPGTLLHIYGNGYWSSGIRTEYNGGGGNGWDIVDGMDNNFYIGYGSAASPTPMMTISSAGNVGIGTTSPSYTLQVNGTAWVTYGVYSASDHSWKKDIAPLTDSLDKITRLQGVSYNWRTAEFPEQHFTEERQIGLIAQDTEKVIPEIVTTNKEGYKGISYEKLTPVLIEAIKELKVDNDNLRLELEQLRAQVDLMAAKTPAGGEGK